MSDPPYEPARAFRSRRSSSCTATSTGRIAGACALTDAFTQAQALGVRRLSYFGALAVGLPWLSSMLEELDDLFGGEPYPHGIPRNRAALADLLKHALDLGIVARAISVDELVAPEVLDHPGVPDTTAYDVPLSGVRR